MRVIGLLLAALPLFVASRARAEGDELLRGPFPFLNENELSVHAGYAVGLGQAPSGTRAQVDYGLALQRGPWVDIQMGMVAGHCAGDCGAEGGKSVDVLAGLKWKFQTSVPVVPYGKLAVGPVFLFPDDASNTAGFLVRGAVGAHYFFNHWLGLGAEISGATGYASGALGSLDFTLGAEFQF